MHPTTGGRFCGNCQKTVVDFSAMTDGEISRQLQRSTGNFCGRFASHQVNRPLEMARASYSFSFPKTLLGVSLFLGGTLPESRAQTSNALVSQRPINEVNRGEKEHQPPTETNPTDTLRVVRGRVIDAEDKSLMPGVSILIKGTNLGTNSNEKGEFALRIPPELDKTSTALVFQFIGFMPTEVALGRFEMNATLTLKLSSEIMGDMVCVRKPNVWQRIKGVFRGK
jgi:hypothetical protein